MRSRRKLAVAGTVAALVGALVGLLAWRMAANEEAKGLAAAALAGERPQAPDFELPDLQGDGTRSLSSLRGKVVVLNFWASWCVPCREEAPLLQDVWTRWKDRGVVVLGVNARELSSKGREFLSEEGITYPNVHDGKGSTLGRFGIPALPETMFIDADGRVAAYIAGPVDAESLDRSIAVAVGS
jgi:cytochrome c biogenesis protein CcmG, thiol:disulfide interchange protein DsbE